MQGVRRRTGRERQKAKKAASGARRTGAPRDFTKYRSRLSLFKLPPVDEVSLEEFELYAVDRLRALKCIETAKVRWPKRGEEYEKALRTAMKDNIPLSTNVDAETAYDERRKDHVSHFILRLAYCKSEDLRRWFLTHECELFRYRFDQEDGQSVSEFLEFNGLNYTPISQSMKEERLDKLASVGFANNADKVMRTDYFKVAFEEALELIKTRRVYIEAGYAYVPKSDIASIIVGAFRAQLSGALTATSKALPSLEEDTRLLPMLTNLSKQYLGSEYGNTGNKAVEAVTAAAVHQLATESFPMCMRHAHAHLMEHHHLKHGARMQYGLFLKGIGLTLEEAMLFWRSEFGKSMSMDKFEKNHAYNIRHNYGKEGKRTDYTPYSCMKIIMSNPPGTGDAHGCPFRHFDEDQLKLRMMQFKVPPQGISEIMKLVKGQHYQLACVKYFEVTHGDDIHSAMALQHPNQYFQKSREVRTGGDEAGSPKAKMEVEKAAGGPAAAAAAAPAKMEIEGTASDDDLLAAMELPN
mmetsp:Transcript_3262/g.7999  ORF Transcript_3262/g.7999 Transcript_3262/m.7999 type:complete len:523 (+) Transcript_3262:26-1594(+)